MYSVRVKNQRGFSILEVIVVVFIVALVGMIGSVAWFRNKHFSTSYGIVEDRSPVPCNSFKSPVIDTKALQTSRDAYIKAGISAKYFDTHFKLRSTETYNNEGTFANGVSYDTPGTRLIWEICFGDRAVVTQYDYTTDTRFNSFIEDVDDVKLHDFSNIMDYQAGAKLLVQCAGQDPIGNKFSVGFTQPNGHNPPPGPGIYIYASGKMTTWGAFTNYTDYYVNLETGKCSKMDEGYAA